jgi:hypothetical protein
MVPLLEQQTLSVIASRTDDPATIAATITGLDEVQPALGLVAQLVAVGTYAVIGVLPSLPVLDTTIGGEVEDLEDALADLARAVLDCGTAAIVVRGDDEAAVGRTARHLTPVADYFGKAVVSISPARADSSDGAATAVIRVGAPWPTERPTLVVTYDDLTVAATAAQTRQWVSTRENR